MLFELTQASQILKMDFPIFPNNVWIQKQYQFDSGKF